MRGLGYKSVIFNKFLFFKLGYSHRNVLSLIRNSKLYYKKKRRFSILSRNVYVLSNLIEYIKLIRFRGIYKKKGVYIKGIPLTFKDSGKKSGY